MTVLLQPLLESTMRHFKDHLSAVARVAEGGNFQYTQLQRTMHVRLFQSVTVRWIPLQLIVTHCDLLSHLTVLCALRTKLTLARQ